MVRHNRNRRNRRRRVRRHRPAVSPKTIVNGTYYKPPNNIRGVSIRPWNTFMTQFSLPHTTDKHVIVADFTQHLQVTNGLWFSSTSNPINIEVKMIDCQVYGITDQTLSVIFHDLAGAPDVESSVQSLPAKNEYARLGYRWPLSDQSHPLNSVDDAQQRVVTLLATGASSDKALLRARLLWRSTSRTSNFKQIDLRPDKVQDPLVEKLDKLCDLLSHTLVV